MANELTYQSVFTGQEMDERFTAVAQLQAALLEVETALSAKYVKPASGIPETDLDSAVQSALAKARSAVQDLSNYYTKTEIDSLLAAVNSQEYVDVATLPTASASTLGKIYLVGPTDNQYDRYYTSYDGSDYSWVAAGSTEINLSNYATKAELNQLDQKVDGLSYTPGQYYKYSPRELAYDSNYILSDAIKVAKGSTVVWHYGSGSLTTMCIFAFDSSGNQVNYWANNAANERTISNIMSSGADSFYYLRASFLLANIGSIYVKVNDDIVWVPEPEGLKTDMSVTNALLPKAYHPKYLAFNDFAKYSVNANGLIENSNAALHSVAFFPFSQKKLNEKSIKFKSNATRTDGYTWNCRVTIYNYAFELVGLIDTRALPIVFSSGNVAEVETPPQHGMTPAYFRLSMWLRKSGANKSPIVASDFIENDLELVGVEERTIAKSAISTECDVFSTSDFIEAMRGKYTLQAVGLQKEMVFANDATLYVNVKEDIGPMMISFVGRRTSSLTTPKMMVSVNSIMTVTPISIENDYAEIKEYVIPPSIFVGGQILITIPAGVAFTKFTVSPAGAVRNTSPLLWAAHLGVLYGKNSALAFAAASQMGFSSCVANLRTTADNVLVCAHNNAFVAATDGETYNISAKTLAEINALGFYETRTNYEGEPTQKFWYDYFGGQEIVTAAKFLEICRNAGMRPVFSCHQTDLDWSALKVLTDLYGFVGDNVPIIKSFDEDTVYAAKVVYGTNAVYYLNGYEDGAVDAREWTTAKIDAFHAAMEGTTHGVESENTFTDAHIAYALSLGLLVGLFSDVDTETYRQYANKGVTMFTTDRMFSGGLNW